MGLSKREGVRARTWRSGGDAGAFVYPSQPSTTMWLSFNGPPSNSGDDRHRSITARFQISTRIATWVARLDEPAPLAQDEPTRLGRSTQVADLDVIQDVVLEPEEDARVAADLAAPASALDIRGD